MCITWSTLPLYGLTCVSHGLLCHLFQSRVGTIIVTALRMGTRSLSDHPEDRQHIYAQTCIVLHIGRILQS